MNLEQTCNQDYYQANKIEKQVKPNLDESIEQLLKEKKKESEKAN